MRILYITHATDLGGANQSMLQMIKELRQNYDIEPVPVLFGNRKAQNQMIVRKKSNGFSDKLKSLIFKIKQMLGGENEE